MNSIYITSRCLKRINRVAYGDWGDPGEGGSLAPRGLGKSRANFRPGPSRLTTSIVNGNDFLDRGGAGDFEKEWGRGRGRG